MPGHYWYDKYSGFWGKKGHRPSQIISANLDLEGYIESNASNGNTEAHINGREITKVELHVLKAIFLYKDIPFLEDELEYIKLLIQSNMDRYIRTLLEGHNHFEEENLNESRNSQSANAHRLTGYDDASDEESIYSFGSRLKAFSDWLLHTMPSASSDVFSASLIQASAPLVEELWSNPSFQETLNRRSELEGLSSVGNYFLKSAVDIFKPDYKPSHTDILHAEGFPSSLSYMDFSFPPPHADEVDIWDPQYYMIRYQIIRSTSNIIGDDYKSFESQDVRIIIFSISLTDYDQFVIDDDGDLINKMMFNKECFESDECNIYIFNSLYI